MDKLDHLFEDTATVMGKSVDEKVEYLRKDFFLEYPKASEIVQKLDDLISIYPRKSNALLPDNRRTKLRENRIS